MRLRIKLECQNKVIAEISENDLRDEITVGRSHECHWCIPSEDSSVGRKHLRIFRRKHSIYLEDLGSQNGSFINKRRIEGVIKLRAGQRINLGKCAILVEKKALNESGAEFKPYLEVLTGSRKGYRLAVESTGVRIGSDPESTLVLLDDLLVSRSHAFIGCSEGASCWIEDCGSMNGTRVDGEALVRDRKRPLKPGNIIQIAHIDILYTDGTVLERKGRFWRASMVAAAVVALAYGSFLAYQRLVLSDVHRIISEARKAAAEERWNDASRIVSSATGTADYKEVRVEVEELRSLISSWQSTATSWRRSEKTLCDTNVWKSFESVAASDSTRRLAEDLNLLCTGSSSSRNWEWNPDQGKTFFMQAQLAKGILDRVFSVGNLIKSGELNTERLLEEVKSLNTAVNSAESFPEEAQLLSGLCATAKIVRDQAEVLLKSTEKTDVILRGLVTDWPPPLREAINGLRSLSGMGHSAISNGAQRIIPALEALDAAYIEMLARMESARQARFQEAGRPVVLPARDSCARHPMLSELRDKMERSSQALQSQVVQAQSAYKQTKEFLNQFGGSGSLVQKWSDPSLFDSLRKYDCLEGPYPRRSRTEPVSMYDRVVGIEHLYAVLRGEAGSLEKGTWEPEIFRLAYGFNTIDSALNIFESDDFRWLRSGPMGEHAKQLRDMANLRKDLSLRLQQQVVNGKGRDALLSSGILLVVGRDSSQILMDGVRLDEWSNRKLNDLRAELLTLDREYQLASPERQIEIREEILRLGLPGDPVVRQYWLRRA
ncbi:MAG: FHA domain-containing protein, partial [Candidatus Omnitrophota bacterium]